ncbi:TonB-dependent receptor [Robiginitalea sp. M366]|uniref:TonB-dependent receptor n=1 Tax=Robiginitalea aestuariiviva TaxID=3036903 RepID=UPI00240D91A9|nr:TonB-dependent receptor [Robiginitalea aestuariiviva]MDG1571676.1 TonB-dependent receptor [Robiginitalea aestuariiviva]
MSKPLFRFLLLCGALLLPIQLIGQSCTVRGRVQQATGGPGVSGAVLLTLANIHLGETGEDGQFIIPVREGQRELVVRAVGFLDLRVVLPHCTGDTLQLGPLILRALPMDEPDYVWLETLADEEDQDPGGGLLGMGRDFFTRRAAFDFSAGYFRTRGLEQQELLATFNGVPMNNPWDGRPMWSSWSGLTDLIRTAGNHRARTFYPRGYGGLLGALEIQGSPAALRPGMRVTLSASNRSYRFRQMVTYNSGQSNTGLGYLISMARRDGDRGYLDGTSYQSLAGYAALEWEFLPGQQLLFSGLLSHTRRGLSGALTEEVTAIQGRQYNPHWGWQNGKIRNSRVQDTEEPLLTFTYTGKTPKAQWELAIGHQWGGSHRSRLGYFGAPNPDPSNYRYMPSFYYNSPLGPNYANVQKARQAFVSHPQIDWERLYQTNSGAYPEGRAAYLLTGDWQGGSRWKGAGRVSLMLYRGLWLDAGLQASRSLLEARQEILDLLGAAYHKDADPFSGTQNDLEGPEQKGPGAVVGYAFDLKHKGLQGYAQVRYQGNRWEGGVAYHQGKEYAWRYGHFRNGRYPEDSQGFGPSLQGSSQGLKGYLGVRLSGHIWAMAHLGSEFRSPNLRDWYTDPREHHFYIPAERERVRGASLDLHLRFPRLSGRLGGYFNRFDGGRSLRSYYAETAFGDAFVRELALGLGARLQGFEAGLEYQLSPEVSLNLAAGLARHRYAGRAGLLLFAAPGAGLPEVASGPEGLDLGDADLDGLPLARGPETALALGVRYRAPKYWWLDVRTVYLARSFPSLALIRTTDAFRNPPNNTLPDGAASTYRELPPHPNPIPEAYLLNLSFGKSWLKGSHYISAFMGWNNVFDQAFRSGGYQQGRMATQTGYNRDARSGHPSFGPRYWQGQGRNFFINIAWSF